MHCFEILPDSDNYHSLVMHDSSITYTEVREMFTTGNKLSDIWVPIQVEIYEQRLSGDFPSMFAGTPPVFSEKAVNVLSPLISSTAEFLPLDNPGANYFVVNVKIVDCLDRSLSQYTCFKDGLRVKSIQHYVFQEDRLNNINIFRIPEESVSRTFVSEDFKHMAINGGLEGLIYRQVT